VDSGSALPKFLVSSQNLQVHALDVNKKLISHLLHPMVVMTHSTFACSVDPIHFHPAATWITDQGNFQRIPLLRFRAFPAEAHEEAQRSSDTDNSVTGVQECGMKATGWRLLSMPVAEIGYRQLIESRGRRASLVVNCTIPTAPVREECACGPNRAITIPEFSTSWAAAEPEDGVPGPARLV
jgi:hypothetical protein